MFAQLFDKLDRQRVTKKFRPVLSQGGRGCMLNRAASKGDSF
jgi:hypothetical protein